ncbi:MAG: DUF3160 domain-containing protein [bacterium]
MKAKRILYLMFSLSIISCFFLCSNIALARKQQIPQQAKINVDVSKLHYLTSEEKQKLSKNGFVIFIPKRPVYYPENEALSIYSKCKTSHFPVFVTSDVILHVSHLLFDWSLRFLEISSLKQDLLNLTDAMLTKSLSYYDRIGDNNSMLKEAALNNAIFFNVAKSILTASELKGIPEDIKQIIEKERALIDEHGGFAVSPLFGYKEDYSQYAPRGHYARSPELARYFKAMMWYGRMGFRLAAIKETEVGYVLDKKTSIAETLQALLICKTLSQTRIKGESALAVWERIYETTSFFAGRADDLTVRQYKELMDKIYGPEPRLSNIASEEKVTEFIKQARRLRKPRILSTYVTDVSSRAVDWKTQTQAFRFMGQRFTPDSHIFQNLVYDKVKWYTGKGRKPFTAVFANGAWFRGFPRGPDVMAVLGSKVAEQILKEQKDTEFQGYKEQFLKLQKEYSLTDRSTWTRELYWSRLWAVKSILDGPPANAPHFMQSEAWLKKQLNTALGSWTELKHDTIVYTKQPYSMAQAAFSVIGKGVHLPPEPVHGYVEPVPELYSRVREAVTQLRLRLTSLGFPSDKALESNFNSFEAILTGLENIAKKELAGQIPSESEYELVENIGSRLKWVLRAAHYLDVTEKFRSKMDNKMPIVADVFTDVNTNMVLEQAIGIPAEIFVIANVDGKDKVCLGVAYCYYEFKQPMSNRLTDEKWRSMIKQNKQPPIPKWMEEVAVKQK